MFNQFFSKQIYFVRFTLLLHASGTFMHRMHCSCNLVITCHHVCDFCYFPAWRKNKVVLNNPTNSSKDCLTRPFAFLIPTEWARLQFTAKLYKRDIKADACRFSCAVIGWRAATQTLIGFTFWQRRGLCAPQAGMKERCERRLVNKSGRRWRRTRKAVEVAGLRKAWMEDVHRSTKRGPWVSRCCSVSSSVPPSAALPFHGRPPRHLPLASVSSQVSLPAE